MEYGAFATYFANVANLNGISEIQKDAMEKFFQLSDRLLQENLKYNLTAIKDEKDVIVKHFADSLLISPNIKSGANVIDVGCGAGFPSLPLAIFRNDITVTSLDSTAKKIDFLNETADILGLTNITGKAMRAEEASHLPEFREKFDTVTARAVASLPVLSELCLPFVLSNGCFIAMKAKDPESEIRDSISAIDKCGGMYYKTVYKTLRSEGSDEEKRSLIIIKKIEKTSEIYPRKYARIIKKPL